MSKVRVGLQEEEDEEEEVEEVEEEEEEEEEIIILFIYFLCKIYHTHGGECKSDDMCVE